MKAVAEDVREAVDISLVPIALQFGGTWPGATNFTITGSVDHASRTITGRGTISQVAGLPLLDATLAGVFAGHESQMVCFAVSKDPRGQPNVYLEMKLDSWRSGTANCLFFYDQVWESVSGAVQPCRS